MSDKIKGIAFLGYLSVGVLVYYLIVIAIFQLTRSFGIAIASSIPVGVAYIAGLHYLIKSL